MAAPLLGIVAEEVACLRPQPGAGNDPGVRRRADNFQGRRPRLFAFRTLLEKRDLPCTDEHPIAPVKPRKFPPTGRATGFWNAGFKPQRDSKAAGVRPLRSNRTYWRECSRDKTNRRACKQAHQGDLYQERANTRVEIHAPFCPRRFSIMERQCIQKSHTPPFWPLRPDISTS